MADVSDNWTEGCRGLIRVREGAIEWRERRTDAWLSLSVREATRRWNRTSVQWYFLREHGFVRVMSGPSGSSTTVGRYIRMTPDDFDALSALADERGETISAVISAAIALLKNSPCAR